MAYIVYSILCSVAVSVLLKLAPRWNVDLRQAIAGSYVVAVVLCVVFLNPTPSLLLQRPDDPAWRVLIALGILLPGMFLVLATSVARVGMAVSDAAQRLSLLLSLIAAFTLFGEVLTAPKGLGVAIGLVAIVCIVMRGGNGPTAVNRNWAWPALVFVGVAVIDILFKRMAQLTAVPFTDVLLATFVLASALSLLYVGVLYWRKHAYWHWRHLAGALAIGAFNFGNILFYVQAHRHLAGDPALVFSAMNIGVIVLAAFVGLVFFRERLSRLNNLGLGLAVLAVLVLAAA